MVGTSRCIAATLLKFGGPETLPQAMPSLCVRTSDSVLLGRARVRERSRGVIRPAHMVVRSTKNKIQAKSEKGLLRLRVVSEGLWAHVQWGEAGASFVAAA
jgi:type IV secretory pathway protease TraF